MFCDMLKFKVIFSVFSKTSFFIVQVGLCKNSDLMTLIVLERQFFREQMSDMWSVSGHAQNGVLRGERTEKKTIWLPVPVSGKMRRLVCVLPAFVRVLDAWVRPCI